MSFIAELKRRNVFKVAVAYLVASWLLLQLTEVLTELLELSTDVGKIVILLLVIGFIPALVFAWAYEITPQGLKLEKQVVPEESITQVTGRKLNLLIIGMLVIALAYFSYDKFVLDPGRDAAIAEAARQQAQQANWVTAPKAGRRTIAVLPFVNLSDDAGNEYFSDGITEELLNLLAKIPGLRVTSRSSAFSFKGQKVDVPSVAAKLGVSHVLEGSVRKAGNRVRITVQLIRADTDTQIWAQSFDRELADVFAIQDEIAREVVSALRLELLGDAPTATATNAEAFTLYLRARHLDSQATIEGWNAAIKAYQQALAIDAEFAPAWAGLANSQRNLANMDFERLHSATEAARQSATRALELDPNNAEAWAAMARIEFFYNWDWDRALENIRTALDHGPGDTRVLQIASRIALGLGDWKSALEYAEKAVEIDPLSAASLRNLAVIHLAMRQYGQQEAVLARLLELHPAQKDAQAFLAQSMILQGRSEEALQRLDPASGNFWHMWNQALAYAELGRQPEADRALQAMVDRWGDGSAYQIAALHAWRGEADQAFEWLKIAHRNRDGGYTQLLTDPVMASLHADPRWTTALDQVGLLPYWQALRPTPGTSGP